ncbi:16S rRNA (guanine(966)-N(2))-methyltransferase RsmD [Agarivorans sp. TSD2052]|uniref:16S rRNA (guanine(966)-N(2))-methyltransferase RsmD n=1 Tax=Agarivorans sp. TSD2052 TaxID=2937286 RepID=UPI00200F1866|nr:16S rRNA (guanine(966)-N(2))-methyltransferase RsmD [Agarivorans sp. TSD2052]UPW19064.1 16S rRNA (guanine(966)-N(2))-methyltransferase RsmD [Agarivorans sp. TSD2052]
MARLSSRKHSNQSNKSSNGSGQVRIIAGQWRGRKLKVLNSEGLRPTTDRVKETVFNWLSPYLHNSHCLDLFAGSGSLGFEALSRFASFTTFIEKDALATKQLKANLQLLNVSSEQANLVNTDALQWLKQRPSEAYDIVFIDPPFRCDLLIPSCDLLNQRGWLKPDALVYIEFENEALEPQFPANWTCIKSKQAGQVSYRLFQSS